MTQDELWRGRFIVLTLARLAGLAIFILGVAIMYTDLLKDGGWPQVGAILAILGALDALLVPRVLTRVWAKQDRPGVELPNNDPLEWP